MTRSLSNAKVSLALTGTVRNAMTFNTSRVASGAISHTVDTSLSDGVSSGEANRAWEYKADLASGASETIDLSTMTGINLGAGDGNDIVGQTMNPIAEIVAIVVSNENARTVAGYLEVEPGAANGWAGLGTHTVATTGALGGQGTLFKQQPGDPGFVLDATHKNLKLTASGGDLTYKITVFGRHDEDESSSSSVSSSSSSPSSQSSSSSSLSSSSSSSSSVSSSSSSSVSSSSSSSSSSTS